MQQLYTSNCGDVESVLQCFNEMKVNAVDYIIGPLLNWVILLNWSVCNSILPEEKKAVEDFLYYSKILQLYVKNIIDTKPAA